MLHSCLVLSDPNILSSFFEHVTLNFFFDQQMEYLPCADYFPMKMCLDYFPTTMFMDDPFNGSM